VLLLLFGIAAAVVALFVFSRMRSRLEASFLADELREAGEGTWRAVPIHPSGGRLAPSKLEGEVGGDRVEAAGPLLFLPFEHSRELAILRQETPVHGAESFVSCGHAGIDGTLAFRSRDPEWLRAFLARDDVRQALAPLCTRAGDDSSFVAVRAGRGAGEPPYDKLVGDRSGLFYYRDPEAGPLDADDIRDVLRVLRPLKRTLV
jgi:hypothetical protein